MGAIVLLLQHTKRVNWAYNNNGVQEMVFTARRSYASADLIGSRNSVSVCPSVRLSHAFCG